MDFLTVLAVLLISVATLSLGRRRAMAEETGGEQVLPKRIKFVMDCSGSLGK